MHFGHAKPVIEESLGSRHAPCVADEKAGRGPRPCHPWSWRDARTGTCAQVHAPDLQVSLEVAAKLASRKRNTALLGSGLHAARSKAHIEIDTMSQQESAYASVDAPLSEASARGICGAALISTCCCCRCHILKLAQEYVRLAFREPGCRDSVDGWPDSWRRDAELSNPASTRTLRCDMTGLCTTHETSCRMMVTRHDYSRPASNAGRGGRTNGL